MQTPFDLQATAEIMGGVPIWGVLPESPAARAGVRYGDIVLQVNGVETRTFREFLAAYDANQGRLELEVFRNGERLRMRLPLDAPISMLN